jgi:predicted nucleotidyltransferase
MVLPAVAAEQLIIDELCGDLVDEFSADSISLILFGSYAYGEQDESSDIDVFALAEDSLHKQRLEARAQAQGPRLMAKYSSPLSLMVYTRAEAAIHLMGGKSSFGIELAVTGIILHGLGVDEWGIDGEEHSNEGGCPGGSPKVPREG